MFLRLAFAAALIAAPSLAAEPPEGPVTTAGATKSVAEQIDAYLRSSPVLEVEPVDAIDGVVPAQIDRRPHGEVSVAVGTGGYRSVYARTEMPLGDTGSVSLAFGDTRYGRAYGGPYGGFYGAGPGFGLDRQRCGLEGMTPLRSLDSTFGGPHGRCASPIPSW